MRARLVAHNPVFFMITLLLFILVPMGFVLAAPGNDDLDSPIVIDPAALPYNIVIDTTDMTVEIDEADPLCTDSLGSVWWSFTPTVTTMYRIDTAGSESPANDTVLSLYEPGTHPLTEIACDDEGGLNSNSVIITTLTAGTEVLIRVADYDDGSLNVGNVHLNVMEFVPLTNDNLADATVIDPLALPYTITQDTAGMTEEGAEVDPIACGDTLGSLWWSFTPAIDGTYQIDTFGSLPPADDTVLSVYTGTDYPLTDVDCNDNYFGSTSAVTLALTAGTSYKIRVADYDDASFDTGIIALNVTNLDLPPVNDDLVNAITILPSALPYFTSINTSGATEEVDELDATCTDTVGSVWWRFTPTDSGIYYIDTSASAPPADDTVLSLHTGVAHPLTEVDCNDDGFSPPTSTLTVPLIAGTTYSIRVADYDDASFDGGNIGLIVALAAPLSPNDNLADATEIDPSALPYNIIQEVFAASLETGENVPSCGTGGAGDGDQGSLWWGFTPTVTGNYQIDTLGSGLGADDTNLAIYTGAGYPLTEIDCNEDVDPDNEIYTSALQRSFTAGTTYFIRVGLYSCECSGVAGGEVFLNVTPLTTTLVSISPNGYTLQEGDSNTITVTRFGDTSADLTVELEIFGDADINDYGITGGIDNQTGTATILIPATVASVDLTFTVTNDASAEPNNSVTLALTDTLDYDLSAPFATVITIPRNDLGVTNLNPDGEGSLYQAIENANAFGGANEIVIPAGNYIAIAPLVISSDLTLTGDSTATTSLDGNNIQQVLVINSGTVLLRGFSIINGAGANGGGVAVLGGVVTIGNDPVVITGNTATTCGGGLYVGTGATVDVEAGSQITLNTTTADGGGICVEDGTLTVSGPTTAVNTNTATGNGGGIYQTGGSASVTVQTTATISGNGAASSGGIYQNGGALVVSDSLIQSNNGNDGAIRFGDNNTRSVTNTCIVNNDDTSVTFAGGSGVIATGNWWGSAAGPFSNADTPTPPNDDNTLTSAGDSVTFSNDVSVFDYSGYLLTPPHVGCLVCLETSGVGQGSVCTIN